MRTAERVWSGKSRPIPSTTRPGGDAGAAAVEFALVVPILLLLVFGIIGWGLIFAAQISLNSAARDAARQGVVRSLSGTGPTCSTIAQSARDNATTVGLNSKDIAVKVTTASASCTWAKGVTITVNTTQMCLGTTGQLVVELNYTAVSPVPLVPPTPIDLTAKGAFQCEYS